MSLLLQVPHAQAHRLLDSQSSQPTIEVLVDDGLLQVVKIIENTSTSISIVVGEVVCVNLRKDLPCLKSSQRKYLFVENDEIIGITLPSSESDAVVHRFEAVIHSFSEKMIDQSPQLPQEPSTPLPEPSPALPATSDVDQQQDESAVVTVTTEQSDPITGTTSSPRVQQIARNIEKASEVVATKLVATASYIGHGLLRGSEHINSKVRRNENETQISERTLRVIQKSKHIAQTTSQVSGQVADGIHTIANSVVNKAGDHATASPTVRKVASSPFTQNAFEIAKSTLIAAANVYDSAVESGVILLRHTAVATEKIVRHKHGDQAGDAAAEAVVIVEEVGKTTLNVNRMKPKAVLKGVVINYARNKLVDETKPTDEIETETESTAPETAPVTSETVTDAATTTNQLAPIPSNI